MGLTHAYGVQWGVGGNPTMGERKMKMKNIGIIGQGFVGTAVREGFRRRFNVVTYDIRDGGRVWRYDNLHRHISDMAALEAVDGPIFLCLPTPMREDGSCDTLIVENVVTEWGRKGNPHIMVIKSTVPPGTTSRLYRSHPILQFVFNPEFLTEAHSTQDFLDQDRIILGGERDAVYEVAEVYGVAFPGVWIVRMTSSEAELVKYVTNTFLAAKVSLANEFKQIADALKIDYDAVIAAAVLDKRLGGSHWKVPGPDGHCGFGGSCFPKDVNGLIRVAEKAGIDPRVLRSVWQKNLEVRPERDWEQLKGRAVVAGVDWSQGWEDKE